MSEFVIVRCNVPNGIVIHISEEAERTDGGERRFAPVETFELKAGGNSVKRKFMRAWLRTNSDSDLLANHLIEFDKEKL